jgi:hypothetical protein
MATLSPQWAEAIREYEFRGVIDEHDPRSPMRVFLERLATSVWETLVRVDSASQGILGLTFSDDPEVHKGHLAIDWRDKDCLDVFLLGPPGAGSRTTRERCTSPHAFDVVDVLLRTLAGVPVPAEQETGWRHAARADRSRFRYWHESEEFWLSQPGAFALFALPPEVQSARAWLVACRWLPAALTLWPCPCILDFGTVFRPDIPPSSEGWADFLGESRARAFGRCKMGESCVSRQLWADTYLIGSGHEFTPSWLEVYLERRVGRLHEYLEAHKGRDAALPAQRTNDALRRTAYHDVVGNPYRPVWPEPFWLTANDHAVEHLARQIDELGEYNRLGLLGDALQDAGCDNQAVLDHCREDGVHGPGCWVVDTLLGRMYTRG